MEISTLNNFFCGLHLLVGMADTASSTLLRLEASNMQLVRSSSAVLPQKSESGTVRLIRTACKALSKHGSEQTGVYQPLMAF